MKAPRANWILFACGLRSGVPEGHPKIAQRFNAGIAVDKENKSRQGRQSSIRSCANSVAPWGLGPSSIANPWFKPWAIVGRPCGTGGFGLVNVLACVAAVLICCFLLFAWLSPNLCGGGRAPRIHCVSNLKQVAVGFRLYANDGDTVIPYPPYTSTNQAWQYFQMVGKEIGSPRVFICPDDPAMKNAKAFPLDFENSTNSFSAPRFQNKALSYFYGANAVSETNAGMLLAGDHHISFTSDITHRTLFLKSNSVVGWTREIHEGQGNVALADGSVQQLSTTRLRQQLALMTNQTQILVLP